MDHTGEVTCDVLAGLIGMCPQIRSLRLDLDWLGLIRPIVDAGSSFARLELLELSASSHTLCLRTVLEVFTQPTIKTLHLTRAGFKYRRATRCTMLSRGSYRS